MRQPKPWRTHVITPAKPGPDVADYFRFRFETQAAAKRAGQVLDPVAQTYRDYQDWAARRPEPPLPATN